MSYGLTGKSMIDCTVLVTVILLGPTAGKSNSDKRVTAGHAIHSSFSLGQYRYRYLK